MPEPDLNVPLYKNPYVIAFVAGIITITAIRPLTRHIPDPPPVIANALPEFSALDLDQERLTIRDVDGRVKVLTLLSGSCSSNCLAALFAQQALHTSFTNNVKDAVLVTLILPGTAMPTNALAWSRPLVDSFPWVFARLETADSGPAWTNFYGSGGSEEAIHDCREPRLVLMDRHGRLRGSYGIGEWGVDEAFYRSTHVLDESLNSSDPHIPNTKN